MEWHVAGLVEFKLDPLKGAPIVSDGPIDQKRKGIAAVLALNQIAEEHKWLAWEELNAQVWIVKTIDSLIKVVDDIHRT